MIRRRTIKVNGIGIFYLDTETDRPPILCLHGRWGRGQTWADLIQRYKDRFRIIAPDQRGHGLSDKPKQDYKAETFAGDMYELIKTLKCDPVIVMGHSMGARMAAYFAALYPQYTKALIILDEPADGPDKKFEIPKDEVSPDDGLTADWPLPFATYNEAVIFLKQKFVRSTNVQYFAESLHETPNGYNFLFSRYSMAVIAAEWHSWYHLLPDIRCPVLLTRAAESWCLPVKNAEKMRGMIKNCTYFEVSNSDHMVYADNPDEFYPQLDKFFNKLT